MSDSIITFPISNKNAPWPLGMSLRDYFAGQALLGLLSCGPHQHNLTVKECTVLAYEAADAMIKAREAK